MAEVYIPSGKRGKRRLSEFIKVDLTPMVDLGFLLITFFVLTTTLQQATITKLFLPKDSEIKTLLPVSATLTFILHRNDSIGYYDGASTQINYANFGAMRMIIQKKQVLLTNNNINKNHLSIIIKPAKESTYKNFIDALDEITISDCRHYFIAEPMREELNLVGKHFN